MFLTVRLAMLMLAAGPGTQLADHRLESLGLPNCANPAIKALGTVERAGHRFDVYQHIWDWNEGLRQTRRLLFFRDDEYLGHYYSTGWDCAVSEDRLICTYFTEELPEILEISADGPSDEALLNGELLTFDRSDWTYNFCDAAAG